VISHVPYPHIFEPHLDLHIISYAFSNTLTFILGTLIKHLSVAVNVNSLPLLYYLFCLLILLDFVSLLLQ